jgi:hypothetical protein
VRRGLLLQRFIGLRIAGGREAEVEGALARLEVLTDCGARAATGRALRAGDAAVFEEAFQGLLRSRRKEMDDDAVREQDDLGVAIGMHLFIEGVAVLKLARRSGIPIAREYPLCPWMALEERPAATPKDEFAPPFAP